MIDKSFRHRFSQPRTAKQGSGLCIDRGHVVKDLRTAQSMTETSQPDCDNGLYPSEHIGLKNICYSANIHHIRNRMCPEEQALLVHARNASRSIGDIIRHGVSDEVSRQLALILLDELSNYIADELPLKFHLPQVT